MTPEEIRARIRELIEQRLRRIEAVIDKLQMSVLQKVGDYMNNVETIKNEITETQKTFKSILNKKQLQLNTKP